MIRKVLLLFFICLCGLNIQAQQNEILDSNIHTLQAQLNGQWNASPYLRLGSNDYIDVSFDDLTHEYHRYRYRIEICDFNWDKNERLFDSDYLNGETSDQPIDNYRKSLNTSVLYTHYSFQFPNERVGVKLSGNYKITIFNDDDTPQDVAVVCFSVVDGKVNLSATATTDTDIDHQRNHQQIKFSVRPANLTITDTEAEIHTVVLQNGRWDNASINPKPDFVTPSEIQWQYDKSLIFKAANEYRKFEMTDMHVGTMGIDKLRWFKPYYHATLYEGKQRRNYVYDEDQDGAYYIRSQEYNDTDIQCDYLLVHFILKADTLLNGELYVNGAFTLGRFLPQYQLKYNSADKSYEAVVLLKQGYYNYQYLYLPTGATAGETQAIEGDYFQTENKYTVLVYYRQQGGRYDQLVSCQEFRYAPGK